MEEHEVIKNVDFKEIKTRFSYLNLKNDPRAHIRKTQSRTEKLQELTEEQLKEANSRSQENEYEYFKYGVDHTAQGATKKTQELVERIKDTSLYIRFQETEGAMRAHVMNKVTHELVAIIPWSQRVRDQQVQQNREFVQLNSQIFGVFGSTLAGGEVDKQI
ncbi:MAG: hypothetical protein JXD21_02440 [Candidatus Omnitrophica bacterium]|nr:hypothetical protein [Candidatus Omnitrophota bacterium]